MKLLIFPVLLLVQSASATLFPSGAFVITSSYIDQIAQIPAQRFRVYAVYAGDADGTFPNNIHIKGADGEKTILELATPKANVDCELSELNVLSGPFTYSNTNAKTTEKDFFTLYFVPTNIPPFPVISAQYASAVDTSLFELKSPACTILSAEKHFELSDFVRDQSKSLIVTTVGFDSPQAPNTVLSVGSSSVDSTVQISGPIATVSNSDSTNSPLRFHVNRTSVYGIEYIPHSSTALLSNGWLNSDESYQMDYANDIVLERVVDYGQEIRVSFTITPGTNYHPKEEQTLYVLCWKANLESSTKYLAEDVAGKTISDSCQTLVLNAFTNAAEEMRFRVTIDSSEGEKHSSPTPPITTTVLPQTTASRLSPVNTVSTQQPSIVTQPFIASTHSTPSIPSTVKTSDTSSLTTSTSLIATTSAAYSISTVSVLIMPLFAFFQL